MQKPIQANHLKTMTKPLKLGIIGHPLGHTLSPVMHNIAAKSHGIELAYDAYDIRPDDLAKEVARLKNLPLDGFNVTVPHKVAVMEQLDEISEEAALIGAVNTVVNRNGRLFGHNTDAYGFITSLRENGGVDPKRKNVFVYGAGGAARGVCIGLAQAGCASITIANRTLEKAVRLTEMVLLTNDQFPVTAIGYDENNLVESVASADIIVNTTSVGMEGSDAKEKLPAVTVIGGACKLVVDIVYRPLETGLLNMAERKGIKTLDGLWMLIHQGDKSFELWTGGKRFPVDEIRAALLERLG